jgi:hypothetical protein
VTISDLSDFIREHYEIHEWRHASAVLAKDFPDEWTDLVAVLTDFRLKKSHIAIGGGNKSNVARTLDAAFGKRGWTAKQFDTEIVVDGTGTQSPTHEIDEYKNRVAVEVEWNNKDPFFDRDLNNFRLLFELRVVSVGVIITRADELQDIFDDLRRGSSYGESTTHMRKLLPKLEGGGGGGCPVLVFGITKKLYQEDE